MQAGKHAVESSQQIGKSPMESAKETIANIAASSKSGMEKTKALIQEKVERLNTTDPVEKDMATFRKEDKLRQAELQKQEAYSQNAVAATNGTQSYTAVGEIDPTPSSEQVSSHVTTGTQSYSTTRTTRTSTPVGQTRTGPEP